MMDRSLGWLLATASAAAMLASPAAAQQGAEQVLPDLTVEVTAPATIIGVSTPMAAPAWALAERRLIDLNAAGVEAFVEKWVDGRGYLRGPEHWGITDGPDDSIEPIRNWPLAHALGGPESIIENWDFVYEGHLDQYSRAKVPEVPTAADGIYQREFMPSFDWEHISEGMAGFYFYGLSRPNDPRYEVRLRRFAGFYLNEDPAAPNYDPEHRIIRSLFNGSRGPNLGEPNPTDWDGPPVPGGAPGRRTRFINATNIRGDHPLNLASTNLALHAYMVTGEDKYRDWVLEYVDAWRERISTNGGNIPSNIGLDGTIGGEWDGKWYGGIFGWNSPDEGVRNYVLRGPPEAFGNALLLTGDQRYTAVLRRQLDNLYAAGRQENGRLVIPVYYGDQGWYGFYPTDANTPGLSNRRQVEQDIYLWGLQPSDLERLPQEGWIGFLQGRNPDYPLQALQADTEEVRIAAENIRNDDSTYGFPPDDTRWADSNPVATVALINLTMGAADPDGSGHGPLPLHAQVRHFDPEVRRAGLPKDVAALVRQITPEGIELVLVNTNPLKGRRVTVQGGAYAEHQVTAVTVGGRVVPVNASYFDVDLAPGAGTEMTVALDRYVHQPTLHFPWSREARER